MHQLNFELIEQLNITCQWIIDNNIEILNKDHMYSLIRKSIALIAEVKADSPKILQYQNIADEFLQRKKTDKDETEP